MIHLATLDQGEYWVDREGSQHDLKEMTPRHLENVRSHLRRMAANLYRVECSRRSAQLFIGGFHPEDFTEIEFPHTESAEEWLDNTPLIRAITDLLDAIEDQPKKENT